MGKLKPKLREIETIETKFISYILVELIKTIYTRYTRNSKIKSIINKKIWPYFNQKPNSVCYHALLGFYLCQSKIHEFKKHLKQK